MTMTRGMRPAVSSALGVATADERWRLIRVRAVCVKFSLLSRRFGGIRRAEDGELVGDLERPRAEAEQRGRAAAGRTGRAMLADVGEDAAAEQDALEVRRRDLVPEGGD